MTSFGGSIAFCDLFNTGEYMEVAKMKADGVENADEFEATCIETVETMKMEGAADVEIQPVPKESN